MLRIYFWRNYFLELYFVGIRWGPWKRCPRGPCLVEGHQVARVARPSRAHVAANTRLAPPDPSILIQRKIFIVTHSLSTHFKLFTVPHSARHHGLRQHVGLAVRLSPPWPLMIPHSRAPTAPPSLLRHMTTKHPTLPASFSTILNNSTIRRSVPPPPPTPAVLGCVKGRNRLDRREHPTAQLPTSSIWDILLANTASYAGLVRLRLRLVYILERARIEGLVLQRGGCLITPFDT